MTPTLMPFRAEHILAFSHREPVGLDQWGGVMQAVKKETMGPAFTATVGETYLGSAGIAILWAGVGEAWMILAPEVEKHGIWLTRTVRRVFEDIREAFNLRRVQATVRVDSPRNQRWIDLLGFKEEGTMLKYGPDGANYIRYAWVRE